MYYFMIHDLIYEAWNDMWYEDKPEEMLEGGMRSYPNLRSYCVTTGLLFPVMKWPQRGVYHSLPSDADVKNMLSFTPLSHVFMEWCLSSPQEYLPIYIYSDVRFKRLRNCLCLLLEEGEFKPRQNPYFYLSLKCNIYLKCLRKNNLYTIALSALIQVHICIYFWL
jgi:hypothetical protein